MHISHTRLSVALALSFVVGSPGSFAAESGTTATAPVRDASAMALLGQATVAGGSGAEQVRDLTASGKITFFGSEAPVEGRVTIRSRGRNGFRMEADLPEGRRVWIVKGNSGVVREANGEKIELAYQSALNMADLTFPIGHLLTALHDPLISVANRGTEMVDNRLVHRMRLSGMTRGGIPALDEIVGTMDVLIDTTTMEVVLVEDIPFGRVLIAAPGRKNTRPRPRQIKFSDYRTVNGVRVPFRIETHVLGQPMMKISLEKVSFNTGIPDTEFQP